MRSDHQGYRLGHGPARWNETRNTGVWGEKSARGPGLSRSGNPVEEDMGRL